MSGHSPYRGCGSYMYTLSTPVALVGYVLGFTLVAKEGSECSTRSEYDSDANLRADSHNVFADSSDVRYGGDCFGVIG
jgi:hypothetical protein